MKNIEKKVSNDITKKLMAMKLWCKLNIKDSGGMKEFKLRMKSL